LIWHESYLMNFYSLILLLILLTTMIAKRETYRFSSRLLLLIVSSTAIILIVEIFSWGFDTVNAPYAKTLNYAFNLLFFLAGPVIVGLFASYADYMSYRSKERLKKRLYYMHLAIIFPILAIINIFTPIIFSINDVNVYQREPIINVAFASVFLLVLYIIYANIKNRKNNEPGVTSSILIFSIIPLIGGILQMFFYGLLIMWAFVGLAVVVAYIFTETINSSKDYLTKLYTRELAEEYLEHAIEQDEPFSMFLFDIDDLKKINDQQGHSQGDEAIVSFAQSLSAAFPKNSIVSRYGGDEFLVIVRGRSIHSLQDSLDALKEMVTDFHFVESSFHYSYGICERPKNDKTSINELFLRCDQDMYQNKAKNKQKISPTS